MTPESDALPPGASKRIEALSDSVFAIVTTILVLKIKVPELPSNFTKEELWHSIIGIVLSLIAFLFSFLYILIFRINHDAIWKAMTHFTKLRQSDNNCKLVTSFICRIISHHI